MFLALDRANRHLEKPQFDWCIVAGALSDDEEFNPAKPGKEEQNRHKRRRHVPRRGSDRDIAERAMSEANRQLGSLRDDPFIFLYLRICRVGKTGYEYSDQGDRLILIHGLTVAELLGITLHVHRDLLPNLITAAQYFGGQIQTESAKPIKTTTHLNSTQDLNARIQSKELVKMNLQFVNATDHQTIDQQPQAVLR